ncbi:MAG TPA: adenylate kinase [Candidatus Limnocylindria bacterium]|nr:adenylate kinase [Candidatus Limnocylindria bacterium]
MQRINVVGTSGSGKTTFAAELSARLDIPHVELDALNWTGGWQQADPDVMRARVAAAVSGERWVIDGNYSVSRDLVWARADTVVWLDLPRSVVTWRIVTRTLTRLVRRTEMWAGNRESLRMLLSRDSIVWWSVSTYARRRRDYPRLLAAHPDLRVVRLRTPRQADRWLRSVGR